MAFNMNRPIIKGTQQHKASIAKATEKSIVAPATQGADAALVDAGRAYGKSFIPGAIDYSIDSPELNWKKRKKKEKEEETPEETPAVEETPTWDNLSEAHADNPDDYRDNKKVTSIEPPDVKLTPGEYITEEEAIATHSGGKVTDDDLAEIKAEQAKELKRISDAKILKEQKRIDARIKSDKIKAQNKEIRARNKIKQDARDYYGPDVKLTQSKLDAYNEMMRKQQEALDYNPEIEEKDDPEPRKIETQKTKDSGSSTSENKSKQKLLDLKYKLAGPSGRANMEADGYIPSKGKSPAEMRDDRIYRNALQDGPVRKNMIKGGYTPE